MDGKWTPGPWVAEGDPQNRIVWSDDGNRVCFMAHSSGLNDDIDIATSNLIAAAPDLYAALLVAELASEELCQGQDPANECWVTLATIRAALAKARGETK